MFSWAHLPVQNVCTTTVKGGFTYFELPSIQATRTVAVAEACGVHLFGTGIVLVDILLFFR